MNLGCRNQCTKFKCKNQGGNLGYRTRKRCSTCGVFVPIVYGPNCPCCGMKLKTRSRKSAGKGGTRNEK